MMTQRSPLLIAVSALLLGSLAPLARGQESKVELVPIGSEIRDSAKMFGAETFRKVKDEIDRIERETKVAVRIETVDSVGDKTVNAVAGEHVRQWAREQPNSRSSMS